MQFKDTIKLTGEIYFPNVALEKKALDFGCVLNNTEVCQEIKMSNTGPLAVCYKWKFVLDKDNVASNNPDAKQIQSIPETSRTEQTEMDTKTEDMKETLKQLNKLEAMLNRTSEELPSIEEIFDISPLFGTLHPGQSQPVKVTYYGHKEIKAHVVAVCEVQNGPEYELNLGGEASVLNYEISTRFIDLGYVVNIHTSL